jgi:putative PIN family toxin of toxin-antitoxin system
VTSPRTLVLDTNIVLDCFVFADEAAQPVREGLDAGSLRWLATAAMREELERVLAYPKVAPRLAFYGLAPADVLAHFDRHAELVEAAPRAGVRCSDADDQKFVDLAVAHRAALLSKDAAVLALKKRLAALEVAAATTLSA